MEKELPVKKISAWVGLGVLLIVGMVSLGSLIEVNDAGNYQVMQSINGNLTVKFEAGPYAQWFGKVTTYKASDILEFGKGSEEEPILVRFQDGGTAKVSGSVKVRMTAREDKLLLVHKEFKYHDAVKNTLLKPTFTEAVQQTAALMKSEESYSSRRSEFASLLEEQIKRGIFETTAVEVKERDVDGNEFNDVNIVVKLDKDGRKLVRKISPLNEYDVEVIQVIIKDIDYDETIDTLIAKKKEAEQQKVVAKANAEKSKQDTITARERAAAEVAVAKGQEEVEKIKEVTRAEKEKAVAILSAQKDYEAAKLARLTAEQNALAETTKGRAEAEINRLKVSAGLTPQERAEYQMKTADVVSKNLASIALPKMMIFGGGANSPTDPFQAVGLQSFMKISEQLSSGK